MLFIYWLYLNDQRISDLPAGNGLVLIHSFAFSISAFRSASFAKLSSLPGDDSCLVSELLSIFISLSTRVTGNNNTGIMLAQKKNKLNRKA